MHLAKFQYRISPYTSILCHWLTNLFRLTSGDSSPTVCMHGTKKLANNTTMSCMATYSQRTASESGSGSSMIAGDFPTTETDFKGDCDQN